jgi:uncharacterized Zn-finger protein
LCSCLLLSNYSRRYVQYCNCLNIFPLQALKDFLFFQSVKLSSTDSEDTYFVTDISGEGLLGEQSAEFSGLNREERFDSLEIYKKSASRNNNVSGHSSASGREMMSLYQTCVTSFTHQSSEVKGFRGSERSFSCSVCRKRFTNRSDLERHTRVHTGERPYTCEVCKKSFSLRSNLIRHLRIHTGEQAFCCEVCKRQFTHQSSLKIHLRIHTGKRPYSCELCKKHFTQQSSLKSHIRLQTGERPFSCKMCNKTFILSFHLKTHLALHSEEKLFSCEVCKKRFSLRSYLINHLTIHTGE